MTARYLHSLSAPFLPPPYSPPSLVVNIPTVVKEFRLFQFRILLQPFRLSSSHKVLTFASISTESRSFLSSHYGSNLSLRCQPRTLSQASCSPIFHMACDLHLQRAPKSRYLVGCTFVLGASRTRWACRARGLGVISRIDDRYDGTSFSSSLKANRHLFSLWEC